MNDLADWQPTEGATIHWRALSPRGLPSGRYTLATHPDGSGWRLERVNGGELGAMTSEDLITWQARGHVTPIGADELARERQELCLRAQAPLRGNRRGPMLAQHDASDLALFRAVSEPGLAL